jgi:hypothetical protein
MLLAVTTLAAGCGIPLVDPAPAASGVIVRLTQLPGIGPPTGSTAVTPSYTLYADGTLISTTRTGLVRRRVDPARTRDLLRAAVRTLAGDDPEQILDGGALTVHAATAAGTVDGGVLGAGARAARLLDRFAAAARGSEPYEPRLVAVPPARAAGRSAASRRVRSAPAPASPARSPAPRSCPCSNRASGTWTGGRTSSPSARCFPASPAAQTSRTDPGRTDPGRTDPGRTH